MSAFAPAPAPAQEKSFHQHLVKTRMCAYFNKGSCHYGDTCSFAHFASELTNMPNLRKTKLCKAFEQGRCHRTDCRFAHGEQELVKTNVFYKKSICSWFEKGMCHNGSQCRFAHGVEELRGAQAEQMAEFSKEPVMANGQSSDTSFSTKSLNSEAVSPSTSEAAELRDLSPAGSAGATPRMMPMKVYPTLNFEAEPANSPTLHKPLLLPPPGLGTDALVRDLQAEVSLLKQKLARLANMDPQVQDSRSPAPAQVCRPPGSWRSHSAAPPGF